jgi:branched-chain amino acid transport system substrate-binding protein
VTARNFFRWLQLTLLGAIAFWATVPALAGNAKSEANTVSKPPLKIGFLASLSGADAVPARELLNGFQLYLDQMHHQMAGQKVELLIENDEGNPAMGIEKAHKLVEQDHVILIDGLSITPVSLGVAPLADKLRVPIVDCLAASDELTQKRHYKWFLRTSYSASQQSHLHVSESVAILEVEPSGISGSTKL